MLSNQSSLRACSQCSRWSTQESFSKQQWRTAAHKRRCRDCIISPDSEARTHASPAIEQREEKLDISALAVVDREVVDGEWTTDPSAADEEEGEWTTVSKVLCDRRTPLVTPSKDWGLIRSPIPKLVQSRACLQLEVAPC